MNLFFNILIALYLSYYTWGLSRIAWKDGNKFASVVFWLILLTFPSAALYISFRL